MDNRELSEVDQKLTELILIIKRKPEMYIGASSIRRLQGFIIGYESGLGYCGKIWKDRSSFDGFDQWVAETLGFPEATSGWAKMIEVTAGSDTAGLAMFFELFEQYYAGESDSSPNPKHS